MKRNNFIYVQPIKYWGHSYTKKQFIVWLKFKLSWASHILSFKAHLCPSTFVHAVVPFLKPSIPKSLSYDGLFFVIQITEQVSPPQVVFSVTQYGWFPAYTPPSNPATLYLIILHFSFLTHKLCEGRHLVHVACPSIPLPTVSGIWQMFNKILPEWMNEWMSSQYPSLGTTYTFEKTTSSSKWICYLNYSPNQIKLSTFLSWIY